MSRFDNISQKLSIQSTKSKTLFLLTFLFIGAFNMQGQQVNYTVTVTEVQWFSGGTFGPCWEAGAEEYDAKVWAFDNINTALQGGSCITCDNNGNCSTSPNLQIATGTNTCADEITIRFQGGEHDGNNDNNCNFDGNDDCVCGPSNVATISFLNSGPGCTTFNQLGCNTNNHFANVEICWDYVTPLIQNCPSDINVAGSGPACTATATWTPPTESDTCNDCSFTSTHNPGDVFPAGTTTVTYTLDCPDPFVDETCSFDVIVDPTACCDPPMAMCQDITVALDAAGVATITAADIDNGSTADCGVLSLVVNPSSFSCLDKGDVPVTLTITDINGDTDNCMAIVTIEDNTIPVPPAAPADITEQCAADVPAPVDLTATDNCDGDITVSPTEVNTPGDCPNSFTLVRTWTFTDMCGNESEVMQTITVNDDTPPVAPMPPTDITEQCAADVPAPVDLTATDNCDGDITVSPTEVNTPGDCPNSFTLVRTWTFTDMCGNESEVMQTISVNDDTPPVAPMPPTDITEQCAADVPAPVDLTATDNCDGDITVSPTEVNTPGACPSSFTIVRTWTFTDMCGNESEVMQTITVNDDTPPVAPMPPADITEQCAADVPAPVDLTATDNCDGDITVSPTEVNTPGACPNSFTIVRTWTFADMCGNESEVMQTITVNDDTAPTFNEALPEDENITCADPIPPAAVLTATDNCTDPQLVIFLEVDDMGVCPDPQIITRTWTITDDCGNEDEHVQVITIAPDNVIPEITCPIDAIISADVNCLFDADPTITGEPAFADNCGGMTLSFIDSAIEDLDCAATGLTRRFVRTWTGTDVCGNVSETCDQVINILDTEIPIITCPLDGEIPADASCGFDADPIITGEPTATDNCDDVTFTFVDGAVEDLDCAATGYERRFTRTWTGTDECGNVSETCDQIINILDIEIPVITCPLDAIIQSNASCGFDADPTITGEPTATDNCDDVTFTFEDGAVEDLDCAATSFTRRFVRTWTGTDECGNVSETCDQVINILDTEIPIITCPVDAEIPADASCGFDASPLITGEPTATDNCDEVTFTFVDSAIEDLDCEATGYARRLTRTWTSTDECGNVSETCDQVINIVDLIPPVITCPADAAVPALTDCDIDIDPSITGEPTATDNCDEIEFTFVDSDIQDLDCSVEGFTSRIIRTWTGTDECGNISVTCEQVLNIEDLSIPMIDCPVEIEIQVDNNCVFDANPLLTGEPTATDNCDDITFTFEDSELTVLDCASTGFVSSFIRTWTGIDECGNVSEACEQTINLVDNTMPEIMCPADEIIPSDDNCGFNADPAITGEPTGIDNCSSLSFTFVDSDLLVLDCSVDGFARSFIRTWTAIDECGNVSETCDQLINIDDLLDPAFVEDLPQSQVISCSDEIPAAVTLTAVDNCTADQMVSFNEVDDMGLCPDPRIISRTWTAIDDCGNMIEHVQVITIEPDTEAPTAENLPTLNFMCLAEVPAGSADDISEESDNCSVPTITYLGDESDGNTCPETITRTYLIEDECGNSLPIVQLIIVGDETPPIASTPDPIELSCGEPIPAPDPDIVMELMDNCTDGIMVVWDSDVSDGLMCPEMITRTYLVTDACNNELEIIQLIIINDSGIPIINIPDDIFGIEGCEPVSITAENSGLPFSDVLTDITSEAIGGQVEGLTVTDDCGIDSVTYVDIFNDESCEKSVTRTFTVTDVCGFTNTVFQFIVFDCTVASHGTLQIKAVPPGGN